MPEVIRKKETPAEKISPEKELGISRRELLIGSLATAASALFADGVEAGAKKLKEKRPSKEEKASSPKLRFDFFFSYHETAEDFAGIEAKLKEADIVIPEAVAWDEEYRATVEDISYGRRTIADIARAFLDEFKKNNPDSPAPSAEEVLRQYLSTPDGRMLELLYNSKKPVFLLDLPEGHPLLKYSEKTIEDITKAKIDLSNNFAEIIQKRKELIKSFTDAQKAREAYFLSGLKDLKEKLREHPEQYPELMGKKEIAALIPFGAMHTKLYHHLFRSGDTVSRTFAKKEERQPYVFGPHEVDAVRQAYFDKEISDEFVARWIFLSFLQSVLYDKVSIFPADRHSLRLWERRIVDKFSLNEIKAMFDAARASVFGQEGVLFLLMRQQLVEKGIKISESNEELEEMVKNVSAPRPTK